MADPTRTAAERCSAMSRRVRTSQALLARQAGIRASSDQVLAGSRDHLADIGRRAMPSRTPGA